MLDFVLEVLALHALHDPSIIPASSKAAPPENETPKIKLTLRHDEGAIVAVVKTVVAPPTVNADDEDDALYNDPPPSKTEVQASDNNNGTVISSPPPPLLAVSATTGSLSDEFLTYVKGLLDPHDKEKGQAFFAHPDCDSERLMYTLSLALELGIFDEISSMVDPKTRVELVSTASIAICSVLEHSKSHSSRLILVFMLYGDLLTRWGLDVDQLSLSDGFFSLKTASKPHLIRLARLNSLCSVVSLGFSLGVDALFDVIAEIFSQGEVRGSYFSS